MDTLSPADRSARMARVKGKGSNAEIAFIHEYGSSRTPGVHWMETAVNEDEGAIHSIMECGFESLVNEKF